MDAAGAGPGEVPAPSGEDGHATKPTLTITIGLPGSGKSTWARERQAAEVSAGRRCAVVERDAIRDVLGYRYDAGAEVRHAMDRAVTAAQDALVEAFLREGVDVIVAATNLVPARRQALGDLAARVGARFALRDFTGVPVEECIRRDAHRRRYVPGEPCSGVQVGEEVIRRMWAGLQGHGGSAGTGADDGNGGA